MSFSLLKNILVDSEEVSVESRKKLLFYFLYELKIKN